MNSDHRRKCIRLSTVRSGAFRRQWLPISEQCFTSGFSATTALPVALTEQFGDGGKEVRDERYPIRRGKLMAVSQTRLSTDMSQVPFHQRPTSLSVGPFCRARQFQAKSLATGCPSD